MLRIASYNILAPSYIRPDWYPYAQPTDLLWPARQERLVRRLLGLGADVLCLQEVEAEVFQQLRSLLEPAGYAAAYAQKRQSRPDGCATLTRSSFEPSPDTRTLYYRDGRGDVDSGHVALVTRLQLDGRPVSVVNSHIRWDRRDRRGEQHIGYRQVTELVAYLAAERGADEAIVCGDFNAEPETEVMRRVREAGYIDVYTGAPQPTCNINRRTQRIDYILHSPGLIGRPVPLPSILVETPLPSDFEPSDHLPIGADIAAAPNSGVPAGSEVTQ